MSRQKIHYYYSRKAVEVGRNEHYKIIYLWAKRCIKKTARYLSLVACHRVSCEKLIAFRTWCSFWLSAISRFHSSSDADMEKNRHFSKMMKKWTIWKKRIVWKTCLIEGNIYYFASSLGLNSFIRAQLIENIVVKQLPQYKIRVILQTTREREQCFGSKPNEFKPAAIEN